MAVVRKKQDDKNLKTLRELVTSGGSGGNRQCFDCGQKGPTYVNMTIGSFVCTRCSGVLRGLTPPHRVKSISMATFTPEEIEFLKSHGNDVCAKTWLGLWDPKRIIHQDQRELMIDKYERKRYYLEPASPLKSLTNNAATKAPPTMNGNTVNGTKFVADFGSANIFNAVTSGAAVSANASNKSQANSLNGFKIHQNGTNGHNFSNGETTANAAAPTVNGNSNSSSISNANANFADFDHASIYNAAVYQPSIYENATINNNYTSSTSDLFANNLSYRSDLFSSTNNSSALSNNNNSTVQTTSNFFNDISGFNFTNYPPPLQQQQQHQQQQQQWNIWQQFQSPFSTPSPEQSRWSLPMSLNSTSNSLSSSATFTSNSSINSTPPADRYAALKDLDDQLRESKTSINGSAFNSPAPAAASPNPFTQSTPIAITGTATQQSHQIGNPFQTPSAANVFAASSQPGLFGGASSPPFTATQQSFLGYNNGYGGGGSNATTILPNGGALNNGCGGLAYVPQQMTTGSNAVITNIKNPFATVNSLSNSNNPFL
ncbi:arf-GAP domain and FG repeat-containing protein 1 isoform X3 [Hermetia illucens]|uniref:arf-GAP domain and FG repeat-containing protein 1 isoform X3 n=1 Tax=Hermetia illucens TaxID=343691 RepID=UPI0018CBFBCA|nr:arf-GAP domain and FG repeat-containing protein 1 isoform X3 [Hermetia illucens]